MHFNKDVGGGIAIGIALVPVAVIAGFAIAWAWRRIKLAVLYAKPAYLTRRLSTAAGFVGARRAYVIGGQFLRLAVIVGRRDADEQRARHVLFDEFIPLSERAE